MDAIRTTALRRELFEEFDLVLPTITFVVLEVGEQLPVVIVGFVVFLIGVPILLWLVGGRWVFHRVRAAAPFVGPLWMWSAQREFAALLASFMSGMAGNVTAFNTVWTYDIYESYIRPGQSDRHSRLLR